MLPLKFVTVCAPAAAFSSAPSRFQPPMTGQLSGNCISTLLLALPVTRSRASLLLLFTPPNTPRLMALSILMKFMLTEGSPALSQVSPLKLYPV